MVRGEMTPVRFAPPSPLWPMLGNKHNHADSRHKYPARGGCARMKRLKDLLAGQPVADSPGDLFLSSFEPRFSGPGPAEIATTKPKARTKTKRARKSGPRALRPVLSARIRQ